VNIPFEVYAFSDRDDLQPKEIHSPVNEEGHHDRKCNPQFDAKEGAENPITPHAFSLLNFVSSRMNKAEYKIAVRRLYFLAKERYSHMPPQFNLGCTPLNEAVVSAFNIVPQFQEETGVQIVNAVFLTDGQGHGMGCRGGYYNDTFLHDPVTKRDYKADGNETNLYLRILKERTGCNVLGIYLNNARNVAGLRYSFFNDEDVEGAVKTYKKSNYAVASPNRTGYDECYIIQANIGGDETAMDNLTEDASYSKIKNAFIKSAGTIKTNKIIATKMIEVFASTLTK